MTYPQLAMQPGAALRVNTTSAERLSIRTNFAVLMSIVFVLQFARAMNRHSDPDEFQFVAPPALLTQFHELPYVDYPYFHTPDLIFIQAALTAGTLNKLFVARIFSAACGTATIGLLLLAGWQLLQGTNVRIRSTLVGGIVLLFATSRLFTYTSGNAWNHDSAVLSILTACLLHLSGMRSGSLRRIIAAGFLVGLAAGIRLSFALAVVPFVVSILFGPTPLTSRQRWIALSLSILAAAGANIPSIWLAILAPQRFVFGTIGYASLSSAYYRSIHDQYGMTFFSKIGSTLSKFITDPCNLLLLAGFLGAVSIRFLHRFRQARSVEKGIVQELDFIMGLIALLWIGAMGPTPMMQQYNYMLVPFMVLTIFYALRLVSEDRLVFQKITRVVAVAAILFGGTGLLRWYWSIIYLPVPSHWQPMVQHREAGWIESMTHPGARILTIESEIPLEAGLEIYPEYATGRFVLLVEKFETPQLRKKNGLVGPAELPALLTARPPDAAFARTSHGCDQLFVEYAKANHFKPHLAPDGTSTLWVKSRR